MTDKHTEAHLLEEFIIANGVNGTSGDYITPEITGQQLIEMLKDRKKEPPPGNLDKLKEKKFREEEKDYGPVSRVDPKRLGPKTKAGEKDGAGWGVIYGPGMTPEIEEALSPLINLRKEQAGDIFREYTYQGESSEDFLVDNDVSLAGAADPKEMPYYLLLVGGPDEIPFHFQFELAIDRALGRIFFNTAEEYHNYAQSVVAVEKGQVRLPRRASFFGVQNRNDRATKLSTNLLIEPLSGEFSSRLAKDWQVASYLRNEATRAQLKNLLGGKQAETPAFLFTASHGMGFDRSDNRQLAHQGALLCSDWENTGGRVSEDVYFAGEHLASDAQLHGLISFFFACYGAGTPGYDEFMQKYKGTPKQIAPQPFVAKLPQRMLSHPNGGSLAVIGHVERAWTHSFKQSGSDTPHLGVFDSVLDQLFAGYPVGHAFDYINARYGSSAVRLTTQLEKLRKKINVSKLQIIRLWTMHNDARDYIILGDPAVRLAVSDKEDEAALPSTIELKEVDLAPYKPGAAPAAPSADDQTKASGDGSHAISSQDANADDAEAMGIIPDELKARVKHALKTVTAQVADALRDLSTLEVLTYLSDDDLKNVYDPQKKAFREQAKLKAVTLIEMDGDVKSMIPARKVETLSEEGNKLSVTVEVDEELLKIHKDMVALAQSNRATFFKNLAEVAVTLVNTGFV